MATNSIEQCQWDAKTGKIYLNIPAVNGPLGTDSVPGAVVVIDPVSMSVENVFTIPLSACTGPMGMAIGHENQILLGCSANGTPQKLGDHQQTERRGRIDPHWLRWDRRGLVQWRQRPLHLAVLPSGMSYCSGGDCSRADRGHRFTWVPGGSIGDDSHATVAVYTGTYRTFKHDAPSEIGRVRS
jgi:hypothetical protein